MGFDFHIYWFHHYLDKLISIFFIILIFTLIDLAVDITLELPDLSFPPPLPNVCPVLLLWSCELS